MQVDETERGEETSDNRRRDAVVTRRDTLRLSGALGVAALGGFGTNVVNVASAATPAWTLVAVPDTQKYVGRSSLVSYAQEQTDWIADNLETENIAFVTHEGDWVDDGSDRTEWRRMHSVWNAIEGKVPYAAAVGDHDYAVEEDRGSSTANYRRFFGERRYRGYSWFGGSAPNDLSHYQRFSAGDYEFLHLDLEWEAPGDPDDPDTPVGWAQRVLDAHPDTPTIVTTHSYLWDRPGREGRTTFVEENSGDGNSGQQLFRKLVAPNPQVFMVLCGNFHEARGTDDGEWAQVSRNDAGLDVYELLACYQDYPKGGEGWLRLLRFVPGGGSGGRDRIEVRTYSPTLDEFQTDGRSQFRFDLRFADRFGASSADEDSSDDDSDAADGDTDDDAADGDTDDDAADGDRDDTDESTETRTLTFQTGRGEYDGTVDTYLQEDRPTADNGAASTLVVDTNDPHGTGRVVQALLRFDDVVGDGDGRVPRGATVQSASLTLRTVDRGDGAALHRLLVDWRDSDSWNSLGDGVQADGEQAVGEADVTTGRVAAGTTTVDVTASVRAWVAGEPNHGWVFRPSGGNGWDFVSSEGSTPPELTVTFGVASE